ncbi:hypothetical protein [Dyadobacter sp. CY312]|uniref:hypothetical protein n=1 Tax=Dyadobacter sp. CY312 TaxID=2907303 RepID=UPI001F2D6DA4|nr:hypothetical protein [Dyadobacter sp. CY312]MCE7039238.1 hypothetical protein [Dyadobacter sp. CY312]
MDTDQSMEDVRELKESIQLIENGMEELFYTLIAQRVRRKSIEEIVEISVLDFFKIGRIAFHGKSFLRRGQPANIPEEEKNILEARKWFVSIMRYILLKNTFSLKLNYPFYHPNIEQRHRADFLGSINPKTQKDYDNRKVFLGLGQLIKRTCLEEGVFDERIDQL